MTTSGDTQSEMTCDNNKQKINYKSQQLKQYYQDKNSVLVGLNDSQGVDTGLLFRKGILEYVRDMLVNSKDEMAVFNAFSLMFNKTEHIDYLLDANLSLAEVKHLQIEGMVCALSKFFHTDLQLPKVFGDLGKIGYISKTLYKTQEGDYKLCLSDTLIKSEEPIVIYSSGANDLMREGWCNPFNIGKAYQNREQDPTYYYALKQFQNPNTIKRVIDRVEHNFEHILTLNDKTDICALGLYLPNTMNQEGMEVFEEAIKEYNAQLQVLCQKYHNSYIATDLIGNKLSKDRSNFHASYSIQQLLAEQVIEKLYQKKTQLQENVIFTPVNNEHSDTTGLLEFFLKFYDDIINLNKELDKQFEYAIDIETLDKIYKTEQMDMYSKREFDIYGYKTKELQSQQEVVFKAWQKSIKRK